MMSLFVGVVSDEGAKIEKWLDLVVMHDHSFNFVDKPRTK